MSSWHVNPDTARAYAKGRLDEPACWSLEAHVQRCTTCARVVSAAADPLVLAGIREHVLDQIRPPVRGLIRLVVTPTLSPSWLAAVAGVVVGVLLLDVLHATRVPSLLLFAPLLPLLGLAVTCAPAVDGSAELMASTPVSTLYVLLLRSASVLCASVPALLVVSLATSDTPLLWLAPAAGLVSLALALSTRLGVGAATGCAAATWAVLTLIPVALRVPSPPGLRPGLAVGWWVLAAVSLALLRVRHEQLDRWTSKTGAWR